MFFAILVLVSAFLIEGIGTYVSVVGLSSLFAANPVIIVLAIALDVGKVVTVSFLYKYWKKVNLLMKTYMTIAAIVLMGITSAGAFGYLSAQFQKAIATTNESGVVITALTDEQERLQKRKEEIDAQIAKLPDNMVAGRRALMKQFGPEVERINTRLVTIDAELPKLKVETLHKNVEVGPIIYIAEAFGTTPEQAVKWVIMIIIFVFDPLAIALLLAGNYLLLMLKQERAETKAKINEMRETSIVVNPISEITSYCEPSSVAIKISPDDVLNTTFVAPTAVQENIPEVKHENIPLTEEIFAPSPIEENITPEEYVAVITPEEYAEAANETVKVEDEPVVAELLEEAAGANREVITLDQITGHDKVHKSLLENVSTKSDVIINLNEHRVDSSLLKRYTE